MSTERYISSAQNSEYKNWLQLAAGKVLKNSNLPPELKQPIMLEGEHLCQSWLELYGPPVQVIISESLLNNGKYDHIWLACSKSHRNILTGNLDKQLVQVKHGIGLFFVVNKPINNVPDKLEQNCIALDRVQDPGNLGTMMRTAAAAGIKHVFLSSGCAKPWSPKVMRSAQGAHFALNIHENQNLATLTAKYSMPMACTTLQNAINIYSADLKQNYIWLFGNEGQGVSQELQDNCSLRVKIPQSDQVESLNVAAAAAICLFEQKRQLGDY